MMRFNNDYNCGAHPEIIKALENTNNESYCGYGLDEWCLKASDEIKKYLGNANADIHFLVGGTQTNFTVIAAALRPFQGVISADSGHINVHETGAVENTGHKVHVLKSENGKITAEQIAKEAEFFNTSDVKEHITQPKMVYISFPTEYGTIYTKQELEEISKTCKKYKLYLFIDGARLGYGLGSKGCDITMKDLAELTDVFYIGGTKCGAFFGEAVVITNDELKENFRSYIKQNGGLLAKGWLLGIQFYTLFKDGLYFDITKKADELALEIKNAFESKGIPSYIESFTNQQFVILPNDAMEKLKKYIYEFEMKIDENHSCVRFCTSWSSKKEDVSELVKDIKLL
ncbi:MAG: aminotransferase class I/II-fold pyridoxal phosphate-dependent enzyme [Clostridia bacterium]|nr:aminotransferase class I/II-fold pyridoxal phosphate-dependent enzyme [Clostridia bacterium]MCI2013826.1 aminotransferase class I/II-fold pyridoxal phosphate-dependent enzyme [Clostridia bacterium]